MKSHQVIFQVYGPQLTDFLKPEEQGIPVDDQGLCGGLVVPLGSEIIEQCLIIFRVVRLIVFPDLQRKLMEQ